MNKFRYLLFGGALLVAIAIAQEAPLYDGKWRGTHKVKTGTDMDVELIIKGQSGTWQWERTKGKWSWPCAGHEFPIVMQSSTPAELTILIEGEKDVKGCGEPVVSLKFVDGNRGLEGTFQKSGSAVKLTRQ